ncbi:MAG: hypothetical protein KBF45_00185 [Cyclobacteriaceae bacterium]|jgi:phosphatidylglycerophosphate synthase|nr:hypothetical protein [Cyclobacteriaceae bacterium]
MRNLPKTLIYSRLVIGTLILIFSLLPINNYKFIAVALFAIGLLTDIFDRTIARHLKISSQDIRRLDSIVDEIFFVMVAVTTIIECPQFFFDNKIKFVILLGAEGLAYLICFIKFKKEVATHSISSKIWTLILFATLIQIMTTCNSTVLFQICFYVGLVTRPEIMAIIIVLRLWTNDVPSLYHTYLIRQGKVIKRHKLFNG